MKDKNGDGDFDDPSEKANDGSHVQTPLGQPGKETEDQLTDEEKEAGKVYGKHGIVF